MLNLNAMRWEACLKSATSNRFQATLNLQAWCVDTQNYKCIPTTVRPVSSAAVLSAAVEGPAGDRLAAWLLFWCRRQVLVHHCQSWNSAFHSVSESAKLLLALAYSRPGINARSGSCQTAVGLLAPHAVALRPRRLRRLVGAVSASWFDRGWGGRARGESSPQRGGEGLLHGCWGGGSPCRWPSLVSAGNRR